jgi:transposase
MEMANPNKRAEYQEQDEQEDSVEIEEVPDPNHPTCPRCGWHNTRPSYSTGMLDSLLRTFSLRAFRCRSCGNRFHRVRRITKQ